MNSSTAVAPDRAHNRQGGEGPFGRHGQAQPRGDLPPGDGVLRALQGEDAEDDDEAEGGYEEGDHLLQVFVEPAVEQHPQQREDDAVPHRLGKPRKHRAHHPPHRTEDADKGDHDPEEAGDAQPGVPGGAAQPEPPDPVERLDGGLVVEQALPAQLDLDEVLDNRGDDDPPQEHEADFGPHARGHQQLAGADHRSGDDDPGADVAQQAAEAAGRFPDFVRRFVVHKPVVFWGFEVRSPGVFGLSACRRCALPAGEPTRRSGLQ